MARKKFHTEIWAEAFFTVTGKDAEKVYLCLKTLSIPVFRIHHSAFFGHSVSEELEEIMRASLKDAADDMAVEYSIRFICLLVEKKCFRFINSFLRRIEQKLDEQKGIVTVTVETAAPMDSDFEKELIQMIKERTGATDIKMIPRVRPELLSGYLLRIGGFFIDATLKGQLETMRSDLYAP